MKGKITKRKVDGLNSGDSLADDEVRGFVARRLPSGLVTYGFRYRDKVNGRQRWIGLGLHGSITPEQARSLARKAAGEVADGRNPAGDRETERSEAAKRVSLGSVVPKYLRDREHEFKPATYRAQARYVERYWLPLHDIAIGDVERKNVVAVIDAIAEEHGRVAADRARTALSAFFTWAIDRGYVDHNPVQNIQRRSQTGPRSRVLSEVELVNVWKACLDDDYGRIIRLLILTGQRKSEIGGLDWREIDSDKRQIDLPPLRVKNGRQHLLPLSDEALAIFNSVPRREDCRFVFGRGAGGFSGWSKSKAELDKRIAAAKAQAALEAGGKPKPMAPWTVHDIRRSVVTHLHERGFAQPHIVEAIVNHVSGHQAGVAGIYNKAQYLPERRRALDVWGAHIAALVAGRETSVVALARAAERA